jgi:hypothetical protein
MKKSNSDKKYGERRRIPGIIILAAVTLLLSGVIYLKFIKAYNISVNNASLPEEIVYVKSSDNIVNCGVIFNAKKSTSKHAAIIWVHGWGVNFYSPTYTSVGRGIAEMGYTCISVNTRMPDLGNVEGL